MFGDQVKQYNEDALHSCEIGFNFNVFPVAQKYLKLQEIYDSYEPILESGLVNPENGLKQMLEELKQNGLDEVIAENADSLNRGKTARINGDYVGIV